ERWFCGSRRRHTRWVSDWSSDVCSSDRDEGRPGISGDLPGEEPDREHRTRGCSEDEQVVGPDQPEHGLKGEARQTEREREGVEEERDALGVEEIGRPERVRVEDEETLSHPPDIPEELVDVVRAVLEHPRAEME